MAALANSKHEHFAQAIAKGVSASKAYVSAGYSPKGAKQSAARMRTNADLCSRIRELQATLAAGVVDVHAKKEIWKFDSALEAAIRKTLKQAAIEEGQWNEKR